jgi:hypothetical protein
MKKLNNSDDIRSLYTKLYLHELKADALLSIEKENGRISFEMKLPNYDMKKLWSEYYMYYMCIEDLNKLFYINKQLTFNNHNIFVNKKYAR